VGRSCWMVHASHATDGRRWRQRRAPNALQGCSASLKHRRGTLDTASCHRNTDSVFDWCRFGGRTPAFTLAERGGWTLWIFTVETSSVVVSEATVALEVCLDTSVIGRFESTCTEGDCVIVSPKAKHVCRLRWSDCFRSVSIVARDTCA